MWCGGCFSLCFPVTIGEHKQKQLWIWGPTGNGKTYLWDSFLEKYCNIFIIPDDDRFMGKWKDDQYDLAVSLASESLEC